MKGFYSHIFAFFSKCASRFGQKLNPLRRVGWGGALAQEFDSEFRSQRHCPDIQSFQGPCPSRDFHGTHILARLARCAVVEVHARGFSCTRIALATANLVCTNIDYGWGLRLSWRDGLLGNVVRGPTPTHSTGFYSKGFTACSRQPTDLYSIVAMRKKCAKCRNASSLPHCCLA